MRRYPTFDTIERATTEGHLWLREFVLGGPLRVSVSRDGRLSIGDADRVYREGEVPLRLRFAARHVSERLDRDVLRAAVSDPTAVVIVGVATRHEAIPYDFDRLPPVLGTEVWDGTAGRRLAVDDAERVIERVGLTPVNAVEKEVPVRDFQPDRYEVPTSAWYPGPAAGVVVRNRNGRRALLRHHAFDPETGPTPVEDVEAAAALATETRIEAAVASLTDAGRPVTVEATFERVIDRVVRECYARLFVDDGLVVDRRAFRSAVAERVRRTLE